MGKSTSQYEALVDDLVDKFSVDMTNVYSLDEFESNFKAIDTQKKFSSSFLNILSGLTKSQDIIDSNVEREKEKITTGFSTIEVSEEVDQYAQTLKLKDEPALKDFIKKQQTQRKSYTARRERYQEDIQIRKQDLFDNAETRTRYFNKWSAVQNQYKLTDEELLQIQKDNPNIRLS